MSFLVGSLLGAVVALLLVLLPAVALQLALRRFVPAQTGRMAKGPRGQGQRGPFRHPRTRRLGLFRAVP